MKKSDIPCVPDCPRRTWDCHGKCPEYADYRKRSDEERERIHKIKKEIIALDEADYRRCNRNKNKR